MENYTNSFKPKTDAPVVEEAIVETPVAEAPVVEAPVAEEVAPEPVKAEEAPEAPTAIKTTDFGRSTAEAQSVGSVANGAIGVTTTPAPEAKPAKKSSAKKPEKEETVAVHSTRNVTWEGVGKLYRGYNIVAKSAADEWLTRSHVRLATPEEVAKEFGK